MEQIGCFGDVDRDPGGRVVSIAYFALINIADYSETLMKEHNAKWFSIDKIPALVFDHKKCCCWRRNACSKKLPITLLVLNCCLKNLPCGNYRIYTKLFTAAKLDKRNLRVKYFSLSILNKLEEKIRNHPGRDLFYFVFDEKKYTKLEAEGVKFI